MLALLALLGVSEIFQPGRLMRAVRSLPTTKERDSIFMGSGSDYRSRIMMLIYRIGILCLLLMWYSNASWTGWHVGYVALCVALCCFIKWLLQNWVGATFFSGKELEVFVRHYLYLKDSCSSFLFPVLLLALFAPGLGRVAILVACGILFAGYLLLLLYKIMALFRSSPMLLVGLPIYVCTVELLPLCGMFILTQQTNTITL